MSFRKFNTDEDTQLVTLVDLKGVEVYASQAYLDRFKVSDLETGTAIHYFGYTDLDGSYYIMQSDTNNGTYRYYRGTTGYVQAWTDRATHIYDYMFNVFN